MDTRFFGETHGSTAVHVLSSATELQSEEGADGALDWSEADQMKPCPMSCAVERSSFEVDDVSDGRGVHRRPFDSYWIGFTVGPVLYTLELRVPPGSVSEEQAQEIASAYYDRLTAG